MSDNTTRHIWGLLLILVGGASCLFLVALFSPIWIVYDLNPNWSSNGKSIVFVCYRPSIDLNELTEPKRYYGDIPYKPEDAEICSMAPDGSKREQLTRNRAPDDDPIWSPDGTQIAFTSKRDNGWSLFIMGANGSQQRRVSRTKGILDLAWSPDGEQIAFSVTDNGGIHILNLETGSERQIIQEYARHPIWSPDGKTIAFVTEEAILENECEVRVIQVDAGDEIASPTKADCKKPAWSPDGTQLAFVGPRNDLGKNNVQILDFQTLQTFELTIDDEAVKSDLVWSPEGDQIFYLAEGEIFTAQVDGGVANQVTNLNSTAFFFLGNRNLILSPDGKQIVFLRGEGTDSLADRVRIWKINNGGSDLRRLSP